MKLIQLEYFCETARCLSITRAAQKLYVTQPAVSSAVKELEKEFSVQLFTHVGNRLALTEEGKAFYEQGEQLLRQVEDTSRKLKDLGKQVPAVRIGIPPLLSTVLFPELLLQLKEECPKVRAELFEYGSARAAELVQKEELDLALVNMDFFEIDKFHSRCLWEDPFLFCTRFSHPLAGKKKITAEMLREEPLLLYNTDSVQNRSIHQWLEAAGVRPEALLHSSQIVTIRKFILAGLGSSFFYSSLMEENPDLAGIPLEPAVPQRIGVIWRKGRYLNAGSEKVLSCLTGCGNFCGKRW